MALKTAVVQSSDEQAITAQEVTDIKTDLALENVDNNVVALNTAKRSYPLADEQRLANTSGTNTGDQDISGIGVNANAINDIEQEQIMQNNAISLNTAKRSYPLADENKLALIQNEATANQTDAFLLDRANHTGTQSSETITHEATEGNVSGTSILDPTTPLAYWNLVGNFELTGVTAIPLNENKVVTRVITTGTGFETLTIPAGWNVYGTFDPTKRNLATILIGNVASGVDVDVIFNQPN